MPCFLAPTVVGVLTAALVAQTAHAAGIEEAEASDAVHEHRFVVGAGGALEAVGGSSVNLGGSAFLEWGAVDSWLELELGVAILAAEGGVEVPIGLLFKKPFRLARRVELMVGLGPEVVAYRGTPNDGNFLALEVAADFMFWPTARFGFWIEPSYELTARGAGEHSLAATGGLIYGW